MPSPRRGSDRKPLIALVVAEPQDRLLQRMVGDSRDQSTLLGNAEIGKGSVEFESWLSAAHANIRGFAIYFAASAERRSYKAESIDGVTLAAVVFTDEDRYIFFKTNSLVLERTEVIQPERFQKHGDSVTQLCGLIAAFRSAHVHHLLNDLKESIVR